MASLPLSGIPLSESAEIPRVFCAVDTIDLARAAFLAKIAVDAGFGVKLGKEFFFAHGPEGIDRVLPQNAAFFLDAKFHDIPNTVAGAVRAAAARLRPDFITIHAAGGAAMIEAAKKTALAAEKPPRILAVTVLTSLDQSDLSAIGIAGDVTAQVLRLAALAEKSGADGLVCAASEIAPLRARLPRDFGLMVPGIRPKGAEAGDQKRVMTPADALNAGASWLVIGRPITDAPDPAAAAAAIAAEVKAATSLAAMAQQRL